MEWLTAWFASVWSSFERWGKSAVLTLWDMIADSFYWIMDTISSLVSMILNGLGNSYASMDLLPALSFLPPEVSNIMGLIGLGQCMALIVAAIGIRVILQLIPFTRLGS
jgi:hypothetical protein